MSNLPAKKELTKVEILQNELSADEITQQLKNVLQENAAAFSTSLVDIYSGDDKLQACEPRLVVKEAMKAASLKLPISKGLGFAYILPYKGVPQFQIGYKGYIQLALRTNQYAFINADLVYEGEITRNDKLRGFIELNGERKSDTVVGAFAYIEMINGFSKMLYMSVDQIENHAAKYSSSWGKDFSPWKNDFEGMAKKTVLKNVLSHYGFLSVEMQKAFANDNEDNMEQISKKIEKATKTDAITDITFEETTTTPPAKQTEKPTKEKEKKPLAF